MSDFVAKLEYTPVATPITIEFDIPPERDPLRERINTKQRTSISENGSVQTQFNYNEEIINPRFRGLSKTIVDLLRTFYIDHGSKGKEFKWFEDKDSASFRTVTLQKFNIRPQREIPQGTGSDFKYRVDLTMRRTL